MEETKKAFVLMPFKEPYNSYYAEIYKPALEAASYIVSRVDDLSTPRPIILDIQQSILEANLILCDMSERNPNVFYELGLAHAIGKPAILVARKEDLSTKKEDEAPFDIRHVRIVLFDFSLPGWEKKLQQNITNAAWAVKETRNAWPPPLIEDEFSKLLKKFEMEKMTALHEADIRQIKFESEMKLQTMMQKLELQEIEYEKSSVDFQAEIKQIQLRSQATIQELEKKIADQEARIKQIKARSAAEQQNSIQQIEIQKIELEKATAEYQIRQENLARAVDAIVQALSSQSYPPDSGTYEVIKDLLLELRAATTR